MVSMPPGGARHRNCSHRQRRPGYGTGRARISAASRQASIKISQNPPNATTTSAVPPVDAGRRVSATTADAASENGAEPSSASTRASHRGDPVGPGPGRRRPRHREAETERRAGRDRRRIHRPGGGDGQEGRGQRGVERRHDQVPPPVGRALGVAGVVGGTIPRRPLLAGVRDQAQFEEPHLGEAGLELRVRAALGRLAQW